MESKITNNGTDFKQVIYHFWAQDPNCKVRMIMLIPEGCMRMEWDNLSKDVSRGLVSDKCSQMLVQAILKKKKPQVF
jgi:hypothetical protein